ncbi:unnamed protein product [Lactuca virosa]|uniref:Mechanosensitive ion channel MscS domain-containing protein n=1 Tax=Lactuca virosa TaxID=75947 RepID=A0AAU9LRB2_9ASTR|nr:unnamed protein product [Lactuca virosa]
MSGISLVISKPWCRVYNPCTGENNKSNFGTSNKIHFGTKPNNKMDLIPCRLSNSILRISSTVATNHMLKHRVYSSSSSSYARKDVTDSTSQPPYGLYGLVAIIGFALPKAWEAAMHFFSATEGVAAVFASRGFFDNIMYGFAVLKDKPFSNGDHIEVGYLKCQVIEMGLITTSLITDTNRPLAVPTSWFYGQVIMNESRQSTIVPYSMLCGQVFVNKPMPPWHAMVSKIYVEKDELEKVRKITDEIPDMMRSNPNVYLEEQQPYCEVSLGNYFELTIGCYLKQASEEELYLAKQDILLQLAQLIKKHGCKVGGHRGEEDLQTSITQRYPCQQNRLVIEGGLHDFSEEL